MSDQTPNSPKGYNTDSTNPGYTGRGDPTARADTTVRVDATGRPDANRAPQRVNSGGSGFGTGAMVAIVFVVVALLAYALYEPNSDAQSGAGASEGTVGQSEGSSISEGDASGTVQGGGAVADPAANDAFPEDSTTGNATPPTGIDGNADAPAATVPNDAAPAPAEQTDGTPDAAPAEPAPAN